MDGKKVKKDMVREGTCTRKVINQNGSLYVSLPKRFAEDQRIKAGDYVSMIWGSSLRVYPTEK